MKKMKNSLELNLITDIKTYKRYANKMIIALKNNFIIIGSLLVSLIK